MSIEHVENLQSLVQKLQNYHLELELQNEELRRAHNELEFSRDRLAELYHFSPVAYLTLSIHGQIIELNMTAALLLENDIIFLRYKPFVSFLAPESQNAFLLHLKLVAKQSAEHHRCELELSHKTRKLIVRLESVGIPDENKNIYKIHTALIDITEQRQIQVRLQDHHQYLEQLVSERTLCLQKTNQKLLESNKAKDQFLALMSHELRTPLHAIITLAGTLQDQLQETLNQKQLKSLRTIEESGQHLTALINNILELSKIQANKLKLDIGIVYVDELCETCLRLVREEASKKEQTLVLKIMSNTKVCYGDERYLRQILVNLLSNAVKFTPKGGTISLQVNGFFCAEAIEFSVIDTGVGIAQSDLKKLFQPFTQLDSRLSRQFGGSGLGLSLVQSLVDIHWGKVLVESEVNRGSCFSVLLPWLRQQDSPHTLLSLPKAQASG
jgi:signal transduction histidine kinase